MATAKERNVARRIEEILRLRRSPLAAQVAGVGNVLVLPQGVREQIIDELGEEFSKKGLKADSEPNAYGLEIEALTDACGPWRGNQ